MGADEIKQSFVALQKEYNNACGMKGHIEAQIWDMENALKENEAEIRSIMKKAKTLQSQMPKEELKGEGNSNGESTTGTNAGSNAA